jgi:hypothetical protein
MSSPAFERMLNLHQLEADVSDQTIKARMKRDLKTMERSLDRGDYESARKAWIVSGRISARIEILMDRAGERDRLAHLPWDWAEYEAEAREADA